MAELFQLQLDEQKVKDGVWIPFEYDVKLLVCGSTSEGFRRDFNEIMKMNREKIRTTGLSPDERAQLLKPAIARHLLKGWQNITINGTTLKYSESKALELLNNVEGLALFILNAADEREFFRRESQKEAEKN